MSGESAMFCKKCSTETRNDPQFHRTRGRGLAGVLRFLWAILLGTSVCSISQEIPSNAPAVADSTRVSSASKADHIPPPDTTVTWEPALPPQAFPAVILSTGGFSSNPGNSQILCDPRSSFRIRVKSHTAAIRIHVEVRSMVFFGREFLRCDP